jgi:TDG/mug DNA glycosylase family protein
MSLPDILGRDLRVLLVGTTGRTSSPHQAHYYDGRGNHFWTLLHASGLVPAPLAPSDDVALPTYGLGLTDLVWQGDAWDVARLHRAVGRSRPRVVGFVSKTAASAYARATRNRLPREYGALSWTVAGSPAFVLPGPSGANNAMPVQLRAALWSDLVDFLAMV